MDVYRYKVLVKKLNDLIPFLPEEDIEYFNNILLKSQKIIDEYNWGEKVMVNPTLREIGHFNGGCLRTIRAFYKDIEYFHDEKSDELLSIENIIGKTDFSEHLKFSKILFNRKVNHKNLSFLEKALNDSFKIQILEEFQQKNKNILKHPYLYEAV